MLVTNQPQFVEGARISYRDFPTALNAVGQSNKVYKNDIEEYVKMDITAQSAQLGIGLSSNLAQLCLSYLWSKKEKDEEYWQLYHNCIILATLAQLLIDGIKRSFEVDAMLEIERIQAMPVMQRYYSVSVGDGEKRVRRDFPEFMKYVKEIPFTKNGAEIPYDEVKKAKNKIESRIDYSIQCPMNYLQRSLNKIQGGEKKATVDILELFIPMPGKADNRQMGRVRRIVEEYDKWTKLHIQPFEMIYGSDGATDVFNLFVEKSQEVLKEIESYKITRLTMNRLIGSVIGLDNGVNNRKKYIIATKYTRKMLSLLYRYNREMFLNNFKQ